MKIFCLQLRIQFSFCGPELGCCNGSSDSIREGKFPDYQNDDHFRFRTLFHGEIYVANVGLGRIFLLNICGKIWKHVFKYVQM